MAKTRKNAAVERITVTISPALKRLLDSAAEGQGMSRSEAAQAAIRDWTMRAQEEDLEREFGFRAEVRAQGDRLAAMVSEAQIAALMSFETVLRGSSRVGEEDVEEIRRRAANRQRRRREERRSGRSDG